MTMRTLVLAVSAVGMLAGCPGPTTPGDGGGDWPAPVVNMVTPTSGPVSGGTAVTITGSNFRDGATVAFGGVAALDVVVQGPTRLSARTPARSSPGVVEVRVNNADGQYGTSSTGFEYLPGSTQTKTIDEAVLRLPALTTDSSGQAIVTVKVKADVQVGSATKGAGQAPGVRAQVGWATVVSSPPTGADFTWSEAAYLADVDGAASGDLARDQYGADVPLVGPGDGGVSTYLLAARFSLDQGSTWVLADRDGKANGVSAEQLATVELSVAANKDWCKLGGETVTAPQSVPLRAGEAGPLIYGQVYVAGVTDQAGAPGGLTGELGVGAAGTSPDTWAWDAGTWNKDTGAGANDEFQAPLPNPGPGSKRFAFRFRRGTGAWLYCDSDGSTNGFDEAQAGTVVVQPPGLEGCTLQHVTATTVQSGGPVTAYVRVMVSGLSPDAGPTPGLRAQFGVGTQGVDARSSPDWGWREARFGADIAATGEDEFQQDFSLAYTGTRAVAARVSMDDGGTWLGCDSDGSPNGYDVSKQWGVVVTNHGEFGWCNTQWPPVADGGTLIYGRAFKAGLTPDAGADIVAELGVGPKVEDPGVASSWTWTRAGFNTLPADSSNEYQAALPPSAPAGSSYAFRFSRDGGATCFGDLNASPDGFSGELGSSPNLGVVAP